VAADVLTTPGPGAGETARVVEGEAFFAGVWNDLAESILYDHPLLDPWGGRVVVDDFAGVAGLGALGPLFDLMPVETGGHAYPRAELMRMMREAGLENVSRLDVDPPSTLVIGRRP
jgi:hypothetical protein